MSIYAWIGIALTLATIGISVFGRRLVLRLAAIEIFVGNNRVGSSGRITVARFPANANGNAFPSSEFFVNNATAVTRDKNGNIYVASDIGNQVQVYRPDTVGLGSRLRNIQGAATKLHRPTGLALDGQGNLYVAERGGPSNQSAILKFAPEADGNVAPIAIIPSRLPVQGEIAGVNTSLDIASGVGVDYQDGSIYVVTCSELFRSGNSKLLRFDPAANGDVAPVAEITIGISEPQQVSLGGDGAIYVTNRGVNPSITVHAASPAANVPPMRTITSVDLVNPFGIAVDRADNIFVTDTEQQSVIVFAKGVSGNVAPLRKISGSNTGLSNPLGIAVRVI
jgi:hypothetical protein